MGSLRAAGSCRGIGSLMGESYIAETDILKPANDNPRITL